MRIMVGFSKSNLKSFFSINSICNHAFVLKSI